MSNKIVPKQCAVEILNWLIKNVESFIGNDTTTYEIELIIDPSAFAEFSETIKLVSLFKDLDDEEDNLIKNDEDLRNKVAALSQEYSEKKMNKLLKKYPHYDTIVKAKVSLLAILREVHHEIKKKNPCQEIKERLTKLYERMVYYYELKGVKDGELVFEKYNPERSKVEINKLDYSPVEISVSTTPKITNNSTNEVKVGQTKTYSIPQRLIVGLEILLIAEDKIAPLF